MQYPIFSLIIPYFNMAHKLPHLLDSVLKQSLKSLEIIIVDDASQEPCRDIVAGYKNKGLNINLLELPDNVGPKNARIEGVLASKGSILGFADADDLLVGTENLEHHVQTILEKQADILHFNAIHYIADTKQESAWVWAKPFAPQLEGDAIAKAYLAQKRASLVSLKIYTKNLWFKFITSLQPSPRYDYIDNVFLSTFIFLYAKRYVGSDKPGYYYFHTPAKIDLLRRDQRILDLVSLKNFIVKKLDEDKFSLKIKNGFIRQINTWIRYYHNQ